MCVCSNAFRFQLAAIVEQVCVYLLTTKNARKNMRNIISLSLLLLVGISQSVQAMQVPTVLSFAWMFAKTYPFVAGSVAVTAGSGTAVALETSSKLKQKAEELKVREQK